MSLKTQLADYYELLFNKLADQRSNDFLLLRHPLPILLILLGYILFVTKIGPQLMESYAPFKLRKVMLFYNAFQILINAFIFVEAFRHGWGGTYNWICEPIDWTDTPRNRYIARIVHTYFIVKLIDLLDTIFMVLRKRNDHISFLHVYHHAGMCALAWGGAKYLPGGHGTFLGFINAFVHAAMYSYYFYSTLAPKNQRKVWWKKYLTQLQMVQFLLVSVHTIALLFQPECQYPKFVVYILTPQNVFMFILFCDFYRRAYCKPSQKKKS